MIGFALGSAALALVALWVTRKGRVSGNVWVGRLGIVAHRHAVPRLVVRLDLHRDGPPAVGRRAQPEPRRRRRRLAAHRARCVHRDQHRDDPHQSLIAFTLLYGVLAVFWFRLMHRYAIEGVADSEHDPSPDNPDNDPDGAAERPLSFAY